MQKHAGGGLLNNYRVFETDEFIKSLKKLALQEKRFIQNKLNIYVYPQIKKEPCFGNNIKKLKGYVPDTWRYRIGKFRLFYAVDQEEGVIYILTVEYRKDAY